MYIPLLHEWLIPLQSFRHHIDRSVVLYSISHCFISFEFHFFTVRFNVTSLIHHEYFLTLGSTSNTLLLLLAIDHQYISDNYDPIPNISLTIATVFLPFQKALIIPSSFNQSQTFFISDHLSIYIN